jgi:hypothetical protein
MIDDRELEQAWPAQAPDAQFAERVLEATRSPERGRRRTAMIAGIAAAVLAAAAVLLVLARRDTTSEGDVRAAARTEVALGSRGVAVLEAGAHIAWHGDDVVQERGDVFYRVEPGDAFHVHTREADTSVLGTCFRITVNDQETAMKRRDLGAGVVGALVATGVWIGVYEGQVKVAHGGQTTTLAAGETVVADRQGLHAPQSAARTGDSGAATSAALQQRLNALEHEKAQLEKQLAAGGAAKSPYDLTSDDWAKLAEQGGFRYQLPCYQPGGFRPSAQQLEKLGLSDADGDAIQAAYLHANKEFGTTMQGICASFAPDLGISDCISKMFTSLYSQSHENAYAAYKEVAEIRAGKRPEPPPDQLTPQLRMLLYFSQGMKGFESELAQTFGADEAHRIAYADDLCFMANTSR